MPILYPPTAPVLTGDVFSISRFLQSPTLVHRRLRTIAEQRFVADILLNGRIQATGGAIAYEVSESIYTDRDPSPVAPGGEYERALATGGTALLAQVTKYGQDIRITDEAISRQNVNAVERAMTKAVNRAVAYVDTIALAAIAAAVTQTQAAVASWSGSTADPLRDVMLANAQIANLTQGYDATELVVTETLYAYLVSNAKVISGLRRESAAGTTVTESGDVLKIGGKTLRQVPDSRMPAGVGAMLLDPIALGALGYEDIQSPEYTGSADGIQSWSRRDQNATDSWLLRVRRTVVPFVQEPGAGIKLTGV